MYMNWCKIKLTYSLVNYKYDNQMTLFSYKSNHNFT